ncbi:unnamed protein product [Ophioblennius macclurei]
MAGLRGLKVLLLWTGIIGLARCQNPDGTGPLQSTSVAPLPSIPTVTNPSSATTNRPPGLNMLTSDQLNTTAMTAVTEPPTTTPQPTTPLRPPTECSYNVALLKTSFRIEMINVDTADYTINITDEGGSVENRD